MVKIRRTARLSRAAEEISCAKCGCPSFECGREKDSTLGDEYVLVTFECGSCRHFETRSVPARGKVKNGRGRAVK